MNGGDTFLLNNADVDPHLWVILSEPSRNDKRVLIVNLTSWRADKDQSCILNVGDHRYISHKSCVEYREAKIISSDNLRVLFEIKQLRWHVEMRADVLQKIRLCAAGSKFISQESLQLLKEQGLLGNE